MKTCIGLFLVICLLLCCGGPSSTEPAIAETNDGWEIIGQKGDCTAYYHSGWRVYWSICHRSGYAPSSTLAVR